MGSRDFLERLSEGPLRRQRLMHALESASRAAQDAVYGVQSPDGSIRLAMNGRFCIEGLAIDPEAYGEMDPDSLAERVMTTYNLARGVVQGKQLEQVLNPLGIDDGSKHE